MTPPNDFNDTKNTWKILSNEITGIKLLWSFLDGLYFKQKNISLTHAPLLCTIVQSTIMESLLLRLSRVMDPAKSSGKTNNQNISLRRFDNLFKKYSIDTEIIHATWKASNLQTLRNKFLSHNDYEEALSTSHTINFILELSDINAIKVLIKQLSDLQVTVNQKLHSKATFIYSHLNLGIEREINYLKELLIAGNFVANELPKNKSLENAYSQFLFKENHTNSKT